MSKKSLIEDIYPLSSMQEGMLFHSLESPESGLYFEQVACTLVGELDVPAFVNAWQRVVDRHPILRTAFVWEKRDEPFQVVFRQVELPWDHHDWRGLSPDEEERRFAALIIADRARGFALAKPPLLRHALVRTAADRHRLLWSCHHLLLDGWSQTLVIEEVMALYRAACAGGEAHVEPSRPYGEYIAWLRRQSMAEAESFWRRHLDGFTAPTPLAGGLPVHAVARPGRRAGEREHALPAALTAEIQAFAQTHRLTVNTLVQGAWALLLHRYSGRDEVVFGVTVSGRPAELPGVEAMKGLFVNTLPLRSALPDAPEDIRTLPWLADLRRQQVEISRFEHTPLPVVQRWSEVPAGQPLFESILAFESYPMDEALLDWRPHLSIRDIRALGRTNYPLTVIALPGPRLTLRIAYDEGRFTGVAVERMLGHLESALLGLAANPQGLLSAVQLLTDAERHQLVVEWRDTETAYPRERCLHQLVAEQMAGAPDAVAVVHEETRLTYGELARRADRLARRLRSQGVGPEVVVGLFLDRSPEMVVALLAILKAGGAYLPLDPGYPEARLALMLEDSGAAVLLTTGGKLPRLPARRPPTLCLDALAGGEPVPDDGPQAVAAGSENLAYVMYTSGSTGRPKGVAVSHRAVVRLVRGNTFARLTAEEVFLQLAPISFDASTLEIWGSLANGGQLVLMPGERPALEEIGAALARHGITSLWLTAGLFHLMVDERLADLAPLRQLLAGGDALSPARVDRLRRELPGCLLINGYGPTEGTTFTCCSPLSRLPAEVQGSAPLGPPIRNTWVTVFDRSLSSPMPLGLPGELAIGGDGLARGYLARPDLTAGRFVPDPNATRPGERLYKTGDLVRHGDDGSLEFLGRIDQQVKIRGFRVEPGEVEAALSAHPAIRAAVVTVRGEGAGDKRLVAYVVVHGDRPPTPSELRDALRRQLPESMLPAAIVLLDALPLTANGKVDRAALPAPFDPRPETQGEPIAPRTPTEARLAEIWCQVLGLPQVSIEDDFFALGGDSILSIRLVARARQAGLELTPGQVFEHPTIAALAVHVGGASAKAAPAEEATGEVPLTPIERWFFDRRLDPHHFNMSLLLCTAPGLGAAALRPALAALVRQHDALRLRFAPAASGWRQEVSTPEEPPFCHVDLSALPALPADAPRRALELAAAPLQASLDLSAGRLLRAVLFDHGAAQAGRLLLVVHHLAVDVVSWRILLDDLSTGCAQHRRGEAISLPPRTASFRQWARQLAEHASSPVIAAELPAWLAAGATGRQLPLDFAAGANTESSAATVSCSLDAAATEQLLRQVPRAYRMRLDEVLLTALAQSLAAWIGPGAFRIDVERHGRETFATDLDLSRTVGWFTSLFPVELALAGDEAPGAALKAVKEALRRVPGNGQGWGLLRWLAECPEAAQLQELPPAAVAFNYLGQLDEALPDGSPFTPADEPCGPLRSPRAARSHLLEVGASILNGRLQVEWTYGSDTHRPATIEGQADRFMTALRALIDHCLAPGAGGYTPSDFPLAELDQATLDRLLGGLGRVDDLYPLAPLQQGLLFHGLSQPDRGEYVVQFTCRFDGGLDLPRFRRAWSQVAARQPVLRTAFLWQGLAAPLQVVLSAVEIPWRELDWRAIPPTERAERLAAWLEADRRQGFDLRQAPLLRLALLRLEDDDYQFVWSLHHLLVDGWSLSLLLQEVFAGYETAGARLAASRPFRDYVAWVKRQDLERAEAYWRGLLGDFTTPTPVGFERRGGEPLPGELERSLPAAATAEVEALARRHRLTPSTLVLGAWGLLLGRASGEPEVVTGVTVSGRSAALAGFESMVGLFINTLPIRLRMPAEREALPWLEEVQRQQLALQEFEHAPLSAVQKWSGVPAGQELFESAMVFENYPVDAVVYAAAESLGAHEVASLERTHYPLHLVAVPGREIRLRIGYDGRRFERTSVHRMVDQLLRLLPAFAPGRRLGELPWLSPAEAHQLLFEWNDTADEYPREASLPELFAARVAAAPEATAVVDEGGERWSYGRLDAASSRLAWHLWSRGVGRGSQVGISMERSADLAVGLLAILKAGGAYVPLDPDYPDERLGFMLADIQRGGSGTPVVLVHGRTRERLEALAGERICLDRDREEIAFRSAAAPPVRTSAADLAYLVYTSGSTGRPKGVAVPQRAVVRLVRGTNFAQLGPDDRVGHVSNISFDAATFEVWGALLNGGALVVIAREVALSPVELARKLRGQRVTALFLTTALFNQVVREEPAAFRTLRHLLFGGEAVDPTSVERVLAEGAPERLLHVYGPTENTTYATWHRVREVAESGVTVPIGHPLANTTAYVLDPWQGLAAPGELGELYTGGHGLAWGYLNRPELTAERFVPHPWSERGGARLYRTGDLVRRRSDGAIEFVGRVDRQVKLRGFRIELGEIEMALTEHPAVGAAAVVCREDRPGEKRLVAYLVAKAEPLPAVSELRAFLNRRLPDPMVPAAFVPLDALPLSPNGKVDRRALPAPDGVRPDLTPAFAEPRGTAERTLAAIWSAVLKLERIGREDNFFELGGDSILSIQIVARAEEAGLRLSPKQLFEHPTLGELAAVAEAVAERRDEPQETSGEVPLSPIQSWFFELPLPRPEHFNMALLLTVQAGLKTSLLAAAARAVVAHHGALRLRFSRRESGAWRQEQAEGDAPLALPEVDLAGLPPVARAAAIAATAERLDGSLDLERGPLLRMASFRLGRELPGRLLIIVHHLVMDVVSWRILIDDLATTCEQLRGGGRVSLPPRSVSFQRWVRRLAEHSRGAEIAAEIDHWLAPSRNWIDPLPVDRPEGANVEAASRTVTVSLTADETAALREEALRPYRMRIEEVLLTTLARTLGEWTGGAAVLIDVEGHGREEIFPDLLPTRTVGWLTSLSPVLLELPPDGDPGTALMAVKEQLRRVPHHGIGYGLLRYLGDPAVAERLRALPSPQVSFNFLGRLDQAVQEVALFAPAPEAVGSGRHPRAPRTHLLEVNSRIASGELRIEITYGTEIHHRETIERLARRFGEHLSALVAHCRSADAGHFTPSDFPLLQLDQQKVDKIVARFGAKRKTGTR